MHWLGPVEALGRVSCLCIGLGPLGPKGGCSICSLVRARWGPGEGVLFVHWLGPIGAQGGCSVCALIRARWGPGEGVLFVHWLGPIRAQGRVFCLCIV